MSDSLESRVRVLEAEAYRRSQAASGASLIGKGTAELLRQVAYLQLGVEEMHRLFGEMEKRQSWLEDKMVEQTKLLERIAAKLEA